MREIFCQSFSPDGTRLAFLAYSQGQLDLCVMEIDIHRLTTVGVMGTVSQPNIIVSGAPLFFSWSEDSCGLLYQIGRMTPGNLPHSQITKPKVGFAYLSPRPVSMGNFPLVCEGEQKCSPQYPHQFALDFDVECGLFCTPQCAILQPGNVPVWCYMRRAVERHVDDDAGHKNNNHELMIAMADRVGRNSHSSSIGVPCRNGSHNSKVSVHRMGGSVSFAVSPPQQDGCVEGSLIALSHMDDRRVFLNSRLGDLVVCELKGVATFLSACPPPGTERDMALEGRKLLSGNCLGMQWSPNGSRLAFVVASSPWLQWHVWDRPRAPSDVSIIIRGGSFMPSAVLRDDYLPFISQYAQTFSFWSSDSLALLAASIHTSVEGASYTPSQKHSPCILTQDFHKPENDVDGKCAAESSVDREERGVFFIDASTRPCFICKGDMAAWPLQAGDGV